MTGCTVLGIETSCDETAAAVVRLEQDRLRVRSSIVGSQVEVHAPYCGVVPELASRAHLERILPVIRAALDAAGASLDPRRGATGIDAVAVGMRPGLIGSLLVGSSAGKTLAWSLGLPFIGVDHVAAHLAAALLDAEPIPFPALGMVVSGGHTAVFGMHDPITLRLLAKTPDDAVGEAFDKGATILGLPYPGGPQIERCAESGRADAVAFPVPRVDFSFSGLKTALLNATRRAGESHSRDDFAASYQHALVRALRRGLEHAWERAVDAGPSPRALVVGGGVAANRTLRRELESMAQDRGVPLRLPPIAYCLDNAAMIGALGALRAARGERDPLDLAPQPLSSIRA